MHIGIDARLIDGHWGGVQQFIIGLASGLSKHPDKSMQYTFFMFRNHTNWLAPYLQSPNCHITIVGDPPISDSSLKQTIGIRYPSLRSIFHGINFLRRKLPPLSQLDSTIASSGINVMHFPFQRAELTTLPNIYQPWDLQHRHLPNLFTPYECFVRDQLYQTYCHQASIINVASEWAKSDLIQEYNIFEDKIQITPPGSVLDHYPQPDSDELKRIQIKYNLPHKFLFYPAKGWQHKNHLRLLDALKKLNDEDGLNISLVLSGSKSRYDSQIHDHIKRNKLQDKVIHVGYVDAGELNCLYQMAYGLVFPSLFEGWGLPITEALSVGLPIVYANVTSLPEQIGDAGLAFDPLDIDDIASKIRQLWLDKALHKALSNRALKRSHLYSWTNVAHSFHRQYQMLK